MVVVGPQALPTLLKAIAVRKCAYPNLIMHSPKRPRQTQGKLMDSINPPIYQQQSVFQLITSNNVFLHLHHQFVARRILWNFLFHPNSEICHNSRQGSYKFHYIFLTQGIRNLVVIVHSMYPYKSKVFQELLPSSLLSNQFPLSHKECVSHMIHSQLVSQLIHVLSMVPDNDAI